MPKRTNPFGNFRPYKKYKTGPMYYGRPTTGYLRTGGYNRYGRRVWRGRYRLNNLPERKFFDTTTANTTLAAAGTVTQASLNLVDLGNGQNNMLGRKIIIKRITARLTFRKVAESDAVLTNVQGGDSYKFFLIQDRQCNGAAATVALMFANTDIRALNLMENSKRFKILKTWEGDIEQNVSFNSTAAEYFTGETVLQEEWSKKCDIRVDFGAQAGGSRVIGEVRTNNLWLVGFSLNGLTRVESRFRIRFTDE